MTEYRENDGTDRRPPAPPDQNASKPADPLANRPGDPPDRPVELGESDKLDELEELLLDDGGDALAPQPSKPSEPTVTPPELSGQSSATDETEGLRKQVETKDAQLAQVMTAYRGLKKETERLRKRIETRQKRRFEQSKNDFIGNFVEVLDNLDRAIDSIENNFDPDAVLEGIILVRSRLVQLLREEGLEKIFVGGQSFDPTHSEAAGIEPVDDASKDNIVLKELQRGYMLKGALLRPARVIVGRYSHAAGENTTDGGGDAGSPAGSPGAPDESEDPARRNRNDDDA